MYFVTFQSYKSSLDSHIIPIEFELKKSMKALFFYFLIIHNCQHELSSCYKLYVDKSANLEIHFGQLNLFKLFLFKNQKNLCQNNRC